jgi:hypothetical protein
MTTNERPALPVPELKLPHAVRLLQAFALAGKRVAVTPGYTAHENSAGDTVIALFPRQPGFPAELRVTRGHHMVAWLRLRGATFSLLSGNREAVLELAQTVAMHAPALVARSASKPALTTRPAEAPRLGLKPAVALLRAHAREGWWVDRGLYEQHENPVADTDLLVTLRPYDPGPSFPETLEVRKGDERLAMVELRGAVLSVVRGSRDAVLEAAEALLAHDPALAAVVPRSKRG